MPYLTDGILDIAEAQLAKTLFDVPATIDVIHGDQFYRGMMTIDQDGLPDKMLETLKRLNTSQKAQTEETQRQEAAQSAKQHERRKS